MRIGVLTVAPSPHLAGILAALRQVPGVQLSVACLTGRLRGRRWEASATGVEWTVLQRWPSGAMRDFLSKTSVLLLATSYFRPATLHAVLVARERGVPVVPWWEMPSTMSPAVVRAVRPWIIRWLLGHAEGLVGITEDTARWYAHTFSFSRLVSWCPYHRDLSSFLALDPRAPGDGLVRFVVLGSLTRRKAAEVVIRALSLVSTKGRVVIVGDGPERGWLDQLTQRLAPGRVSFLGSLPFDQTSRAFDGAHALVIPSIHDGFGMAVMEAFAAGVPVIASVGVGSARQYVEEGRNGWLVPVGDPSAVAARMNELIARAWEWQAFSAAARATLRRYNPETDALRLASFLRSVVGEEGSPGGSR